MKPNCASQLLFRINGIPGSAIVMIGLVIALLGYGSWYFVFTPDDFVSKVAPLDSHDLVKSAQTDRRNLAPIAQNPLVEPSSANAASAKLLTENAKNIEKHKEPTADVNAKSELTEEILQNAKTASPSDKLTGTTAMSVNPKLAPVSESNSSVEPNRKFASQEISEVRQEESRAIDSNNGEANGTRTSLAQADIEPTRYPDALKNAEANQPIGEVVIKAKNAENRTPSMVIEPSLVQAALDDSAPDTLSKLPDRKNNEAVPSLDATSGVNPQDRVDEEVASVLETNTQSNLSNRPDKKVLSVPDVTSGSSLADRIDEEGTSIANVETGTSNREKKANPPNTPMVRMETPQISRITLTAKDASWIQVRDINANQLILSKVLLKGHSYQVPNKQGLSLMTGNAGALEIAVNGEIVPAIGNLGEVRKKVLLEAERLRQGRAVVE